MIGSLTKRLLREWKLLMRSNSRSTTDHQYYLEPHDSNLHIWHLVLRDPKTSLEFYMVLYISDLDSDQGSKCNVSRVSTDNVYSPSPVIMLRCMTPNTSLNIHKNVSLANWSNILLREGLNSLILRIYHSFFTPIKRMLNDSSDNNSNSSNNNNIKRHDIPYLAHLLKAWNCIMCRDYKLYFPELVALLQPGDYQRVRDLARWLQSIQQTHNTLHLRSVEESYPPSQIPPSLLPFFICSYPNDFFTVGLSSDECNVKDHISALHQNSTLFCFNTSSTDSYLCNSNGAIGKYKLPHRLEATLCHEPYQRYSINSLQGLNFSESGIQQSSNNPAQTQDPVLDPDSSDDSNCPSRKRMKI